MVLVVPPVLASLKDSALLTGVAVAATVVTAVLAYRASTGSPPTKAIVVSNDKPLRKAHVLPTSRFLVGDLFEYLRNAERFHDWIAETSLHFRNEPWCLRLIGQSDLFVLTTPEGLEDVFVRQSDLFPRGEETNANIQGLVGKSLLTTDGDEWMRQRRIAAKFFTAKALRVCMTTTMHKNVEQLYEVLDQHIASGAPLDVTHLFGQFALQTFTQVGLGVDLRWIGTDLAHPIGGLMHHGAPPVMRRFRVPTFWWRLEQRLNIGPERTLHREVTTTRQWLQMLITESLDALKKHQRERGKRTDYKADEEDDDDDTIKTVVDLFFEHSQEDATGMRSEDLVDFILSFVVAAQDTSAATLTRFFLMLANHPEVAQRIRREMAAVLPSLGVTKDTYLTTDHIHHLVYLEATMHEVLRLYPTTPLLQRVAAADTVICGDVPVRKGDGMCLHMYAMARNPDVWGPDAAEFNPERWIDQTTGELLKFPPTKFASFGAGPHTCIGMKLAMLELRVVTANLVHRYALSLAVPNDGDYLVGVSLMMKKPLIVKVGHAASAVAANAA